MAEFTKEQLQQIEAAAKEVLWPVVWAEEKARKHFSEKITPEIVLEMARLLLAGMEQEPVAWEVKGILCHTRAEANVYVGVPEPLYAAPQLPQPAVLSVPDGVLKSLLPDAEKPDFWLEHNGKIFFEGVKFNNAVFEAFRTAMPHGVEQSRIEMLCKALKNAPLSPSDSQGRKKVDVDNDNQQFESLSRGNK